MKQWILMLCTATLLFGCATNPVSKRSEFVLMSEKQELAIGQKMAAMVAKQLPLLPEKDPLVQYVKRVGQRVAKYADRPELFYRFHVVDDGTINAFALPGGYIYVHRGLIAHFNSEAELAAVLGHEIGHVTARHAVQRYTQAQTANLGITVAAILTGVPQVAADLSNLLATAVIMGYGREQELQSDELSLKYLARSGYDARATIHLLETLERLEKIDAKEKTDAGDKAEQYHGAFSSHPETKQRIKGAIEKAAAMQKGQQTIIGHEAMLAAIDGYPMKDGDRDGAVVGRKFLHPDLGIQLEFPKNWVIKNTPQALTARVRKEEVYFQLLHKELQKRESATTILKSVFPARRMGPVTTGHRNGFEYAASTIQTSAPYVSMATIRATLWVRGPDAFLVMTYATRGALYEKYRADFDAIHASFHDYDKQRDGDIPRIHIYTWKRGDSWESLARESKNILGRFTADRLAALNGMDVNVRPKAGTRIKIVR